MAENIRNRSIAADIDLAAPAVMKPGFFTVAAGGHVAPTALAIFRDIEKKPAAVNARAALDPIESRLRENVRRRLNDRPQDRGKIGTAFGPAESKAIRRLHQFDIGV